DGKLERPETLCERELLLVREVLVVKDQDSILVHAGMNGGDVRSRKRPCEIDAVDLARKTRTNLADGEGHGASPTNNFCGDPTADGHWCHARAGQPWQPFDASLEHLVEPLVVECAAAGCELLAECARVRRHA